MPAHHVGSPDTTREKIVESAIELFKSKGYRNVSVMNICENCNITRGAFYYYYKTKDEIFDDIFYSSDLLTATTIGQIMQEENYCEQIFMLHDIYLQRVLDLGPELFAQVYRRHIENGTPLTDPHDINLYELYIAIIQKGQAAGQIQNTAEPSALAETIIHFSNSIGLIWCSKKGNYDFCGEIRRIIRAVLMMKD